MTSRELLVASNRGPVSLVADDAGGVRAVRGGGGLVSGMSSALSAGGLWVCCAMGDVEREFAARAPGGHLAAAGVDTGGLDVRMLPVPADTFRDAYQGIANQTLWFVHHLLYDVPTQPAFDASWRSQWDSYRQYNRAFAEALAAEAAQGGTVMVQDYHLFLVPSMLREWRPDVRIGHFTHTPWASPDYFAMLPADVARQVLIGMLGADHLGFHCRRWALAFASCCRRVLDAVVDTGSDPDPATGAAGSDVSVRHGGRTTRIRVHPLGTDGAGLRDRAGAADVRERLAALRDRIGNRRVIGRVDRTEPSKNVVRGLLAYRELLVSHPEWRGRVTHVGYVYPSRQDIALYREYTQAVRGQADRINAEFGTGDWTPVVLELANDYPGSLAALVATDVLLVNPIRDGMNLVAQEGVILAAGGCALGLSEQAGAFDLLGEHALVINPYDITGTAGALHTALSMSDGERVERTRRMVAAATELPPADWFAEQLAAVADRTG
ncbi:MAG TPA: trehalose-6-phosphate synthase [Mycobacteriales bacterium]|nr:trehalose-6-phosphate synthase [Mycobacteriales bacterium]